MSGHYLYQYDADLVALNAVGFVLELPVAMNQLVAVSIPDGVQIDTVPGTPLTAVALATQKEAFLLASFGYDNSTYDEYFDTSKIDAAFTDHRAGIGPMKNTYLQPEDSAATPGLLTSTGHAAGAVVTDFTLVWDLYEYTYQDSMDVENSVGDRVNRLQVARLPVTDVVARVSADDGVSFDVITNGSPKSPTVPGSTLRVQFETIPAETRRIRLGNWYLFYNTV